jgi:hypothetical protein
MQNGMLQNGNVTKRYMLQNGPLYKTARVTKQYMLQNGTHHKMVTLQNGTHYKMARYIMVLVTKWYDQI